MKFVLRYRPEVVADLDTGRRWYEERSAGLGSDFVVECSEVLTRSQRNPEWVGVDAYGLRSLRIRRFPYVIHYRIEGIPWWLLLPQGVSGAIKRRGGLEPFREVAKAGPIPLGGAVATNAGRLPFKAIVHVAGIDLVAGIAEVHSRLHAECPA